MKWFSAVCLMLCINIVWAAGETAPTPGADTVKGEVLEVKDVDNFTYLRLKTKDGETWAAVNKTPVNKGAEVTIENVMVMKNFESKSLKKTFQTIVLGSLRGTGASAQPLGDMAAAHSGVGKADDLGDAKVPKATGPNARTVAEIVAKRAELKDKTVVVRGKVVKYNPGIMGKNWIHLRDGSGSASDNTNDVLVTTKNQTKIGDIVLVKGVVHTDMDFGAGYAYKVLIEEATLEK